MNPVQFEPGVLRKRVLHLPTYFAVLALALVGYIGEWDYAWYGWAALAVSPLVGGVWGIVRPPTPSPRPLSRQQQIAQLTGATGVGLGLVAVGAVIDLTLAIACGLLVVASYFGVSAWMELRRRGIPVLEPRAGQRS